MFLLVELDPDLINNKLHFRTPGTQSFVKLQADYGGCYLIRGISNHAGKICEHNLPMLMLCAHAPFTSFSYPGC